MIVYNGNSYESKAAVVRAMYLSGEVSFIPEDKNRVALLLGMTVQTVHATLIKMVKPIGSPAPIAKPQVVKITDSFADVRKAVEDRYNECYEIAKARGGVDLPKIIILWDLKGKSAGRFNWGWGVCTFEVNLVLAKENLEEYLAQTIPHEFSHYIAYVNWKSKGCWRNPPKHNWEWQRIMLNIFKREPHRCHSYDVSSVSRKVKRFDYKCKCMNHSLTPMKHSKMMFNPRAFVCSRCRTLLTFVKVL